MFTFQKLYNSRDKFQKQSHAKSKNYMKILYEGESTIEASRNVLSWSSNKLIIKSSGIISVCEMPNKARGNTEGAGIGSTPSPSRFGFAKLDIKWKTCPHEHCPDPLPYSYVFK